MPEEFVACDNNRGVSVRPAQPVQKDNIHGNQTPFAAGNPRSSLLELARLASAGRAFLPFSGGVTRGGSSSLPPPAFSKEIAMLGFLRRRRIASLVADRQAARERLEAAQKARDTRAIHYARAALQVATHKLMRAEVSRHGVRN